MRVQGAGALIAGGGSGLGEATARRLHAEGASVTIADLDGERAGALAAELGERARHVRADVRSEEDVAGAVALANRDGGLRVSVCCAGVAWAERVAHRRGAHALDPFERVLAVNLVGTFNVLRLAAAAMAANDPDESGERGVCVQTASVAAFDGQIGQIAYAASKAGVAGMTLPAARDLAAFGVRVVTIAPGLFDTPMLAALPGDVRAALAASVPFPSRLGSPGEYAALVAHIVANPMLNGEVVRLDGALRMAPR